MDIPGYTAETIVTTLVDALLGATIGAEREWRRHPGGLRSSALVSCAASVFAQIAIHHGGTNPGATLGAIATGVGFLGAGVILHTGAQVRGLSTAATYWAVAAVGTACGVVEYAMAIALTVIVLVAHIALRPLSSWIEHRAPPEDPGPR